MLKRASFRVLLLVVFLYAPASTTRAEEPAPPRAAPSPAELLRRLEEAERRIRSLEAELQSSRADKAPSAEAPAKESKPAEKDRDPARELEKRLGKLEKEYTSAKEAAARKKEEDARKNPPARLNGRLQMYHLDWFRDDAGASAFETGDASIDPENALLFRRLRFYIRGEILDNMGYKIDLEFANPELIGFRDAYMTFDNLPGNNTLILGNQKRPLSMEIMNSTLHTWTVERPLPTDAFNLGLRRVGAALAGYTDDESLNWSVGWFLLDDIQATGVDQGDPLQSSFNLRVTGSPWYDECSDGRSYLHLGFSNMLAFPNGFADDADGAPNQARFRTRPEVQSTSFWLDTGAIPNATVFDTFCAEALLTLGPWSLQSEAYVTWVGRENRAGIEPVPGDVTFHGYYITAGYFLTGEHQPYNRRQGVLARMKPYENFFLVERLCGGHGNGWGAVQVAARYSFLNLSDRDIRGGRGNSLTLALSWWWNAYARMQINYVLGEYDNRRPVDGQREGAFAALIAGMYLDW